MDEAPKPPARVLSSEDEKKLQRIRAGIEKGKKDIREGRFITLRTNKEIEDFFRNL